MNCLLICLLLLAVVDLGQSVTCAAMDIPILKEAARIACVASCQAQACATGYCKKRKGQKICVCSRCR
uniref:Antibacterial peptide-3 n=1 Tax=Ancylostoma duodenale TaxID=51022 RepID=A0A0F6MXL9_9BILA|nr:antibacterial peptide-3 [Ancylostoma duodenale]